MTPTTIKINVKHLIKNPFIQRDPKRVRERNEEKRIHTRKGEYGMQCCPKPMAFNSEFITKQ